MFEPESLTWGRYEYITSNPQYWGALEIKSLEFVFLLYSEKQNKENKEKKEEPKKEEAKKEEAKKDAKIESAKKDEADAQGKKDEKQK